MKLFYKLSIVITFAVFTSPSYMIAGGWTGGFERGSNYHSLELDGLKLLVVCDIDNTRGEQSGYLGFEVKGDAMKSGQATITSANSAVSLSVDHGNALEKENTSQFFQVTDKLASTDDVTIDFAGSSWSFRNPSPVNLHCK